MTAMPWPPPMQAEPMALFSPRRLKQKAIINNIQLTHGDVCQFCWYLRFDCIYLVSVEIEISLAIILPFLNTDNVYCVKIASVLLPLAAI